MTSKVSVACLYSPAGLAAVAEHQKLLLSSDTNRALMSFVLSMLGPTVGQKIVKDYVLKCENGWGNEQFEVETILDYQVSEEGEFYLIKWKNWSHYFNTWEPKSNLDCPLLLADFHDALKSGKSNPSGTIHLSEAENKKRKIDELVKQLLYYNRNLTASSLFEALQKLHITHKINLQSSCGQYTARKRKFAAAACISNKRTKAYRLHHDEVKRAIKDWETHLNSISTDPAPIMVENNVDLEGPPQNFFYINDYMPGQNVNLDANPVVGCECSDCYKEKKSCCGCNAGSDFAYYVSKRVRLPPGYPIYECNRRCKCGPDCPNRVVQNGRKHRVCIFRTENGRGWGVKAMQKIKKGSFVMEYVGEVVTNEEAERRGKNYDANGMTYLFDLDYQDPDCPYTVDAGVYGNVSHFVNHSCDPNLTVYGVWINNLDPRLPRIALFASKDIEKGEELTFDYMMTGDTTVPTAEANANATAETVPTAEANGNAIAELPNPPPNISENLLSSQTADLTAEFDAEVSLNTAINNNKPSQVDANLLPAAVATKEQNLESEEVVVRKQKNRIMCQCGSAICRKYLF